MRPQLVKASRFSLVGLGTARETCAACQLMLSSRGFCVRSQSLCILMSAGCAWVPQQCRANLMKPYGRAGSEAQAGPCHAAFHS